MSKFNEAEAAKVILKYSGKNLGMSRIQWITRLILFCKKINNKFQLPMPPKEISIVWELDDWCDRIDLQWNKFGENQK